jgi:preprotein translocase SecE subunit
MDAADQETCVSLRIYKKGQGYWTRVMSAIGWGTVAFMGGIWLARSVRNVRIGSLESIYTQALAFVLFFGFFAYLGYWLIGCHPRVVEFFIATEGEMKKVNWSSRREIRGSTVVVIGLTLVVAVIITVLDYLLYAPLFEWIRVLEAG